MRVLHAAAECFPYVKVGGLADVLGSLPQALQARGVKARLLLPGYPVLKERLSGLVRAAEIPDLLGLGPSTILLGRTQDEVPIYLLDREDLYGRGGSPYQEWGDSFLQWGALSFAAAWLAFHGDARGWKASLLHCHDWQTALAPAHLALWGGPRPASVMTVHNLAYQGVYGPEVLSSLWLPRHAWRWDGLEFYGSLSFLKAGLQYADRLTTVSPTYAQEIQTPAFGQGLEGLLTYRSEDLLGILNGIDTSVWNPARSPHLETHFDASHRSGKKVCKNLLQRDSGLEELSGAPLFAVVSRFAHQKGLDLVVENADYLVNLGAQLVVLGAGDPSLEADFAAVAARHPGRVALRQGFDEALAQRIFAGADALLVPSRHEPCGLTQLYGLRYGALPIVRRTGGLADTVVDTTPETLADGSATGFVFEAPRGWELGAALARACQLYYRELGAWSRVQHNAMRQDFSWRHSAKQYQDLYASLGA